MPITRRVLPALIALGVGACRRYDYRPPSCPPEPPRPQMSVASDAEHPGAVAGVVTSHPDGQPVGFAVVSLGPGVVSDTTDATGQFHLGRVRPGAYRLVTRRLGYVTRADSLSVPVGSGLRLRVPLEEAVLDGCPGFMIEVVPRPWWRWLW